MIARVFLRRTSMTPTDEYAYINCQPPFTAQSDITAVHISVVFTWDMKRAEQLAEMWSVLGVPVLMGGPAFNQPGGDFVPGRYVKQGCTFTSRGCPNHCWFCAVPQREGGLTELPIQDGWNILDDNLLACSDTHVEAVFQMLSRQPHKARFTGGLEAKLLKPWHAKRLRDINPESMYFAYDTPDDYEPLVQAGCLLRDAGFPGRRGQQKCYNLIGYHGDTFDKAEKRLRQTWNAGFMPYAMLYRGEDGSTDADWRKFQREWLRPTIVANKMTKPEPPGGEVEG